MTTALTARIVVEVTRLEYLPGLTAHPASPYTVPMLNIWLTIGYFVALGLVVASRDRFLDNDAAVIGVAAVILFAGLGLWLFVAQSHRDKE